MKFEYKPYHHAISDEEMLSDVKRVVAEIGADSLLQTLCSKCNEGKSSLRLS